MSYDLMVFKADAAPATRADFMAWYEQQTQWTEDHSYDDPAVTSNALRAWFMDMINSFPALNGPFATDAEHDRVTDYCIGKEVIYVAFSWSVAELAYEEMKRKAETHHVGFFDASATDGDILFPDGTGKNLPIDRLDNLSSIQQIKNSALPGQGDMDVKEIIYARVQSQLDKQFNANGQSIPRRSWWKRLLGIQ